MRSIRCLFALASLALGLPGIASAQDVTGIWRAEFEAGPGTQKYTYEFKADGDKLTGKVSGDITGTKFESDVKEGKVKGDEITFVETMKFMDNETRVEYTGKIKGDEIKFTRKVGDFATEDLVAKRVGPAVVAAKGLAGKWMAEFDSPVGIQKYIYEFKVDGEKVTGKARADIAGSKSDSDITDGKIKGDAITFVETLKFMNMDLRIEYTGKLKGDEIQFTRNVADFATEELVARRLPGEAAAPVTPKK